MASYFRRTHPSQAWFPILLKVLPVLLLIFPGFGFSGAESEGRLPRLILIKVDGLSGILLEAAFDPAGPEADRLPHPAQFRTAYRNMLAVLDRDELLPNLSTYFLRNGVRPETIYSATVPVSAPAWGVIDTGQPSIIKNNFYFNRATGEFTGYLDGLRETMDTLLRGAGKTTAVWQLDLLGIPLLEDTFPVGMTWSAMQVFYRQQPAEQLSNAGRFVLKAGEEEADIPGLVRKHLSHLVHRPDYPEHNDHALSLLAGRKVLEKGKSDREQPDFLNLFFPSLDHQFHMDSNYNSILVWLVKIDRWVGEILAAVEQSERRDETLVALISDHGLDFDPVHLNHPFPINRWLREEVFGGHTVLSPHAESSVHALTVPIRGVDFARVYEGDHSPYGNGVKQGEKGYYTVFTANTGNPRFDTFLRNSDLNRLHLLLLEIRRVRDEEQLRHIFPVFQQVLLQTRPWLEDQLERGRATMEALERFDRLFAKKEDGYSQDASARIRREIEGYRLVAQALQRLISIPSEWNSWLQWVSSAPTVSQYIPKGYLGVPNRLDQLRSYVVGWQQPEMSRWSQGPASFQTINYPELFASYRAANPNAYGNRYPFSFFSFALPVEQLSGNWGAPLRQAIWIKASAGKGEALVLESIDGQLGYFPIQQLDYRDGRYFADIKPKNDPFEFSPIIEETPWLSPRRWVEATGDLEYSQLPVILADMFRRNYEAFLEAENFHPQYYGKELLDVEKHIAALRYHFEQGLPDCLVWMNRGWTVNSKDYTPGGVHGGFHPLETRTVFLLWGGRTFALPRGQVIPGSFLTIDIVPTLLHILGRLGPENTIIWNGRDAEKRVFPRLAGRPMPLFKNPRKAD